MRIPRECKLEKALARERTRFTLHCAHVKRNGESAKVSASDGRILVELTVEVNGEIEPEECFLPVEIIKAARGKRQRDEGGEIKVEGDLATCEKPGETRTAKLEDGSYLNVDAVFPAIGPETRWITFNPTLLRNLADGLGSAEIVSLAIPEAREVKGMPVYVRVPGKPDRRGVIMPMTPD
jgi:hypothetical protein